MTRGKFIVIEGGDGVGKDTQIELLKKDFFGDAFVYTRDPGGTDLGHTLREILQHSAHIAQETELLLFLASRAQLVHEVILPALAAGKHVISNRFDLSMTAYQIYARERHAAADDMKLLNAFASGGAVPDLTVLLDAPVEVGLARLLKRGEKLTRFEQEARAFHERVRQGYLEGAKNIPDIVIVDARRRVEEVYRDVHAAVAACVAAADVTRGNPRRVKPDSV